MKDVYVITGATGGIGSEIAKNITKKGIVLISDLDEAKMKDLKKKITKGNVKCEYLKCDVSKLKDVKALAEKANKLGNFKAMVHTAGVSESMDNAESVLKINLIGTKYLMDEFLRIADNSVFINIASMTGHMVPDSKLYNKYLLNPRDNNFLKRMKLFIQGNSQAAYAFSKKGVIMLTERDVDKWSAKNSRLLSISPGAIETPLALLEAKDNPAVDMMIKAAPISRYGTPKEISKLTNYLLSEEAAFMTGVDVLIDGGATSYMKYNDVFGTKKSFDINNVILILTYVIVFLGLPILATITKCSFELYMAMFIMNILTVVIGTLITVKDKVKISLIFLPVALYLLSGLLPAYNISIVNAIFIGIIVYLAQLIKLIHIEEKTSEEPNEKKA